MSTEQPQPVGIGRTIVTGTVQQVGNVSNNVDSKRYCEDVTQSVDEVAKNCHSTNKERYGNRAISRDKAYVVEFYLFTIRPEPIAAPWQDRIEKLWSRTISVTRENFETDYHDAWEERREQWRKLGLITCISGQAINGQITPCDTKVVPCWNCDELVLLDTSNGRFGQYCSDQCRDELHRHNQAESKRLKRAELRVQLTCDYCGLIYQPKRKGSRFCSTRCRVAANRKSKASRGEA